MSPSRDVVKASPDLSVSLPGLRLANPTMLASGIVGISLPLLRRALRAGAGAVVSKSIGLEPREGYKNPTVVETECGYVNAIGLSNPGVDEFLRELSSSDIGDLPLVASIFGGAAEDFERLATRMEGCGAKALELNLSCPHVKGVGVEIAHDPNAVYEIVRAVKGVSSLPVFAKLSPLVTALVDVAKAAERAGADAITAVNTAPAMVIDVDSGRPVLSNRVGGLSGPALKPIAVRCVYEVSRSVAVPVIGCGGIVTWRDTVEFLLAGARAVQIGSAVARRGLRVFREVADGVREYLASKGFRSVGEIVGLSHRF